MEKTRRSERVIALTKYLLDRPAQLVPLTTFTDLFNTAKSSISEDLGIIRDAFRQFGMGRIETQTGAAGGVMYFPEMSDEDSRVLADDLCTRINQPERILPGGFLYLTDLVGAPDLMYRVGLFFATRFADVRPDYVATVETKGIPLGLMTARLLNIPLVIVRSDNRVSEGTSVSISYVSGSQRRLGSMSLPKRALPAGARVLFVDDFMRGGGTARGILDLLSEFDATCVGMGFLVATSDPADKLVKDYLSLLVLEEADDLKRTLRIAPGDWMLE